MATKVQAVRFEKTDKSKIKDSHKRTRTGALKCRNRHRGHGKHSKHLGYR